MRKARAFLPFSCLVFSLGIFVLMIAVEGGFTARYVPTKRTDVPSQGLIHLRRSDDTIPSSPPWVYPKAILTPPACVTSKPSSCSWSTSMISQCSATKCVTTFFGSCMQRDTLVDKSCFCPKLNSENCGPCSTMVQMAQYYHWLNLTCGDVAGWQGLPPSWQSVYSSLDIIKIGIVSYNTYTYGYDLLGGILPRYRIPDCVAQTCPAYSSGWYNSLLGDLDVAWANISNHSPTTSVQSAGNYALDLNRPDVCGSLYQSAKTSCHSMCSSNLGKVQYLLWLNNTCSGAKSFLGLSSDWKAEVAASVANSSLSLYNTSKVVLPDCIGGSCADILTQKINNSSDTFCILDSSGTYCSSNRSMLSFPQFCTNLNYPSTCSDSCTLSFERPELLNFMNTTCSNITGWSGLPGNWSDLLSVQISELKPWPWLIRNNDVNSNATVQCPTPGANLGVFAGTNVAMLLLTPILGRRTVINKLTFGLLGKAHTQSWFFMGPFMAGLQIAANTINALIIRSTPGYSDLNIGRLVLLWCTRPRLAWLVILLVPFEAKKVMYLSCAATTLTAEAILQLLSAYTLGTVANYGRVQHFYNLDHRLDNIPYGLEAKLMYAGSLLWLIVIFFTIVAIIASVAGVNERIASLARLVGADERVVKNLLRKAKALSNSAQRSYVRLLSHPAIFDQNNNDHLQTLQESRSLQVESYDLAISSLNNMSESIITDDKGYEKATKNLKKLKKRSKKGLGTSMEFGELDEMIQEVEDIKFNLNSSSGRHFSVAHQELNKIKQQIDHIQIKMERLYQMSRKIPGESNTAYREKSKRQYQTLQKWEAIRQDLAKLEKIWTKIASKWQARQERFADAPRVTRKRLTDVVTQTMVGMFGCWIAQWIFWAGFVGIFSNQGYCPPKLVTMAINWILFSVFGISVGASV